ncbi:50S ribosomal protein L11 methyltransferase [bacterium]|nr:50S ribosomal protein L11 methyltransferase [bacterium]
MSRIFDEHRALLADRVRLRAYARALDEVVRPGDVVLDLASGTGILGFLACRAGARKVYAVECGTLIELARQIATANGLADRIVFVKGLSRRLSLPERVDVVVADQIAYFGFEAGLLEDFADARERFLKPEGRAVPSRLDLWAAPVECPELFDRVEMWSRGPAGLDFSPARRWAASNVQSFRLRSDHLLGKPACVASLDTCKAGPLTIEATFETSRSGKLHGLGGWFSARLSPGVVLTNAPGAPDALDRENAFFPLSEALEVGAGSTLRATWRYLDAEVLSWTIAGEGRSFTQSTLGSLHLGRDAVRRTDPRFVPALSPRGEALKAALELCSEKRPLSEIEEEVHRRFGETFRSRGDVTGFVADAVARHCL